MGSQWAKENNIHLLQREQGEKGGGGEQTLDRIKCARKKRRQQNMKNIQSTFRDAKIGNTRKVTVIQVSKSLYIILQSKNDCPRLGTRLSIHA
jgi:hypothetical protein